MAIRRILTAHGPRIVLGLFCAVVLLFAALHRGHSVESVDVRTYVQMLRGVADHGLPWWDNGPIERFPQLVVPHGIPGKDGHVWGIYSPLFPYLLAPVFKLGGLRLVSSVTYAMLAPLAIATYLLARRFVPEGYAAGAGVLSVASTPIVGKALEMTPFPLTVLMCTVAALFTVTVVASERPRPLAGALAGASWGLATAAHVLSFPMGVVALAVLAAAPDPATGERTAAGTRARALPAFLGFASVLAPVAWLNHVRFDSWNPISYGRPPWSGPVGMSVGNQAAYGVPVALFVGVVVAAAFLARRKRVALIAIALAAVVAAVAIPTLRVKLVQYAAVGWGYLVDMTLFDLEGPYVRPPHDKVGLMIGGWVVKSTVQCTPIVVLAPLALRGAGPKRWPLIALLAPCAALYLSFLTRANMPFVHAFGWPWAYMRYTVAALPAMLVASMVTIERLRLPRWATIGAVVLGGMLTYVYRTTDEAVLAKRLALLILPLVLVAIVVAAAVWLRETSRLAPLAQACLAGAIGVGIGAALGHDYRAHAEGKYWCDYWVDKFETAVPQRFALIGWHAHFEVLLTTTATHDVRYVGGGGFQPFAEIRPLVDVWRDEGRPIFFHWPFSPTPPGIAPDIAYTRVDPMPDVYRLDFR